MRRLSAIGHRSLKSGLDKLRQNGWRIPIVPAGFVLLTPGAPPLAAVLGSAIGSLVLAEHQSGGAQADDSWRHRLSAPLIVGNNMIRSDVLNCQELGWPRIPQRAGRSGSNTRACSWKKR
jgi:hypothetical protein